MLGKLLQATQQVQAVPQGKRLLARLGTQQHPMHLSQLQQMLLLVAKVKVKWLQAMEAPQALPMAMQAMQQWVTLPWPP